MAKVKCPLFSQEAEGALAELLCFRGGPSGTWVSRPGISPKSTRKRPTSAQAGRRAAYREAVDAWHELTPEARESWVQLAAESSRPVTGFNLFLRQELLAYAPDDGGDDGGGGEPTPVEEPLVLQIPETSIKQGVLMPLGQVTVGAAGSAIPNFTLLSTDGGNWAKDLGVYFATEPVELMADLNTGNCPLYVGGYDNPLLLHRVLWLGSSGGVGVVITSTVSIVPPIDVTGLWVLVGMGWGTAMNEVPHGVWSGTIAFPDVNWVAGAPTI